MKIKIIPGPLNNPKAGAVALHYCIGCKRLHVINFEKPIYSSDGKPQVWRFNGNETRPTFSPSVNIVGYCHYTISDGTIHYHGDCKHAYANQRIDLSDIPSDELADLWR